MRTPLLLLALVACALAAPTPNPGELQPVQPGPDDASWYCQWKRRVIFDRYSLEGKNWGVTERELKKKISSEGSAVSDWSYREDGNGGFKANVSFWCFDFVF